MCSNYNFNNRPMILRNYFIDYLKEHEKVGFSKRMLKEEKSEVMMFSVKGP